VIDLARAGVGEGIVGGEDKDAWGITGLERFWME
jgi:hypothetical protein